MRAMTWWFPLIAGCGVHGAPHDRSMSGFVTAYDDHVDAFQAECEAHGARISAMNDLGRMEQEEAAHRMGVDEHLEGMEHEREHMGMCDDDDGMMADVSHMQEMQEDCEDELDAHWNAMTGAPDVDAAHAEEMRHQAAMADWFDSMGMMSGEMMEMGGMYHCPDDHPHGD